MQTLELSDSAPRTEGRLKSLFWPAIQSADDVEYLGTQGFWICTFVAVLSFALSLFTGHEIIGAIVLLFFYLGGVGVREHSPFAAAAVFVLYVLDSLATGPSVMRIAIAAVLFSNLRATWIAAGWKPDASDAIPPPRLRETWSDKFSDSVPGWLWPKVRAVYYVFSVAFIALEAVGIYSLLRRHR
jgi:hypothetical protein